MAGPTHAEGVAAVIEANATFYRAFTKGDYAAMSELWSKSAPLTCLHPGARVLVGRTAVLDSWRQILGGGSGLTLRCEEPVVHLLGETALVTCYEGSNDDPAHLAATNVFVLEGGRWRLVHHHAGPIATPVRRRRPPSTMN
jgi:ketosteroid isomerase-like protein